MKLKLFFFLLCLGLGFISCERKSIDLESDLNAHDTPVEGTEGVVYLASDTIKYVFRDGNYYLGDDYYLEPIQFNRILSSTKSGTNSRALTMSNLNLRWPGGTIPYTVSGGFVNVARLQEAINRINAETPLTLVPRSNQSNFVEFRSVSGNVSSSALGMVGGLPSGRQYINVADGAGFGTIIHEIFHAAGLQHEHQRSDAGHYIEINWNNIKSGSRNQYETRNGSSIGSFNYQSIMNYDSFVGSAHAIDPSVPVIYLKLPDGSRTTYQANRQYIASSDVLALRYMYGPQDFRFLKRTSVATIHEQYVDQTTDIEDQTYHHTITFHDSQTATVVSPPINFMKIRVHYDIKTYGHGPGNLNTQRTQKDIIIFPGQSSTTFDMRVRYHTYLGYFEPSTYMESIVRIEVINW